MKPPKPLPLADQIKSAQIVVKPVGELLPYARNSRLHSEAQLARIAGSIKEFGFTNPILIDPEGTIIAGHARVLAAQKLDLAEVPCIVLSHLTKTQRRAYVIADNRLAELSSWDSEMLKLELYDLKTDDYDMGMTGFDDDYIGAALSGMTEQIETESFDSINRDPIEGEADEARDPAEVASIAKALYSTKVTTPVYTPKGDKPAISDLFDYSKAEALIAEIESLDIPDSEKQFLRLAAQRHVVFNYEKIAEFYAHASKQLQGVMENSALVIIDFHKAIERGFVVLSESLAEAYRAG